MSIKAKLIVLLCVVLGAGAVVIVAAIRASFADDATLVAEQSVRQAALGFKTLADGERTKLSTTLTALSSDQGLVGAWGKGDRAELLARTQGSYASFKKQGITNWSFTGVDGTTFLRLSDPSYFGEKVDRPTVVQCLAQKAQQSGFATGSQGFALRVAAPVYEGERLLGCMELGAEINSFVATLKVQTGNEFALVLSKQGLDAEKWARGRKLIGLPDNFGDQADVVLAANTANHALAGNVAIGSLDLDGRVLETYARDGGYFSHGAFAIADATGKRAAAIFVETDISALAASMARSQTRAIGVVAGLIIICSLVLTMLFQTMIFRRLEAITRVATRVVGGDFETAIPVTANDEVGRFEELFEQFRQVFLSVLQEAQAAQAANQATPPPPAPKSEAA